MQTANQDAIKQALFQFDAFTIHAQGDAAITVVKLDDSNFIFEACTLDGKCTKVHKTEIFDACVEAWEDFFSKCEKDFTISQLDKRSADAYREPLI